jgi:hypothetical protein
VSFSKLFEICDNKEGSIANYAVKGWQLGLRRMLGDEEIREWIELQTKLRGGQSYSV